MEKMTEKLYQGYIKILREELVPAMGCTEPAALAYAAAKCREALGEIPEKSIAAVSGNLIKNVRSVIVPNTGGMKGIEASIAAGIIGGKAEAGLEVLDAFPKEKQKDIRAYLISHEIKVTLADTEESLYLDLRMYGKQHEARVVLVGQHTNIVCIERDGCKIFDAVDTGTAAKDSDYGEKNTAALEGEKAKYHTLNVKQIIEFAEKVKLEDVQDILEKQITCNMTIAEAGLRENWGAQVGKTCMNQCSDHDILKKAAAYAAAGSDARMGGCSLPVVIVSGSGNQGLTASVPVIVFAQELKKTREELFRALLVSNLVTIHQKSGIGRLSAFCGAVSAGAGAAAGIVYLQGGRYDEIAHTVVNALGILSGMSCDGAKPSCAAKIAAAVEAGYFGYELYANGHQFYAGEGIITKGIEPTIENVGRMARNGMRETDKEILRIMADTDSYIGR